MPLMADVTPFEADLVAYDAAGRPALIVEAKGHPIERPAETLAYVAGLAPAADFWLLADPAKLRLYDVGGSGSAGEPVAVLETLATLREYDSTVADRNLSKFYLIALVDAWVRDLAVGWRAAPPPGVAALRGTGLLDRLANGSTQRGATVHGDRVR